MKKLFITAVSILFMLTAFSQTGSTGKKITDLPARPSINDTDLLFIGNPTGGKQFKATALQMKSYIGVGGVRSSTPTGWNSMLAQNQQQTADGIIDINSHNLAIKSSADYPDGLLTLTRNSDGTYHGFFGDGKSDHNTNGFYFNDDPNNQIVSLGNNKNAKINLINGFGFYQGGAFTVNTEFGKNNVGSKNFNIQADTLDVSYTTGPLPILTPIINVKNPVNAQDAATKAYVDAHVSSGGGGTIPPNTYYNIGGNSGVSGTGFLGFTDAVPLGIGVSNNFDILIGADQSVKVGNQAGNVQSVYSGNTIVSGDVQNNDNGNTTTLEEHNNIFSLNKGMTLQLADVSGNVAQFKASNITNSYSYNVPTAPGSVGQVLGITGTSQLGFVSVGGGTANNNPDSLGNHPAAYYQQHLNGTGLVRANGSTVTYDNSDFLLYEKRISGARSLPFIFLDSGDSLHVGLSGNSMGIQVPTWDTLTGTMDVQNLTMHGNLSSGNNYFGTVRASTDIYLQYPVPHNTFANPWIPAIDTSITDGHYGEIQYQRLSELLANFSGGGGGSTPTNGNPDYYVGGDGNLHQLPTYLTDSTGNGNLTAAAFVYNEKPTGAINGSNKTFTIANTPIAGKYSVYENGFKTDPASDYSFSGTTLTFTVAPSSGAKILIDYIKQ